MTLEMAADIVAELLKRNPRLAFRLYDYFTKHFRLLERDRHGLAYLTIFASMCGYGVDGGRVAGSAGEDKMLLEILTSAERNFMDHYAQETLAFEHGPAFQWLREHRIGPEDIRPYIEARQFELAARDATSYPPKTNRFEVPWNSTDDFYSRGDELDKILEPHRTARCNYSRPPASNE